MKRIITALAVGAVVTTVGYASASSLGVNGGTIQAGQDTVVCDSDGVKANWGLETDDNSVRSVRIEGIDPACVGAELFVKVDNRAVVKTVIDASSESFSFPAPFPTPESIETVRIWIEG